jgi:hypothetical protein
MTNIFQGIHPARIAAWAAIQVMFFVLVFPDLGRYISQQRNLPNYFVACVYALASMVIIAPMLLKASPLSRVAAGLMLIFSAMILLFSLRGILGAI